MLCCCCLQGAHVAEWVKHGLGLPQYVQAFRDNAVSVSGNRRQCLPAAASCVMPVLTVHLSHCPPWRCRAYTALPAYMQVLDFPLLVNDGGATLRDELGVSSNLHRQQILRGIRRIILGMGQPPSVPQVGSCVPKLSCSVDARQR